MRRTNIGRARVPAHLVPMVVVVLVGLHLRGPLVGVSTILDQLRDAWNVSSAELGLLTGVPVLVFGLGAPLALLLVRRLGADVSSILCLGAVCVGAGLRSTGPYYAALIGTLVVGLGIAVGNIAVPVVIRSDVPPRWLAATNALYSATLNVGAVALLLASRPTSDAAGWQTALALPAVTAALAAVALMWIRVPRPSAEARAGHVRTRAATPPRSMLRDPVILLLTAAFAGQATVYYCLSTWLPTILRDTVAPNGATADAAAAIFQLSAVISALALSSLMRSVEPRWSILMAGGLWIAFASQLLLAPHLALAGSFLGGMGQGAGLALMLTLAARRVTSDDESARALTIIQGVGYVLAASSPSAIGALRDATHGWVAPLLVLVVVAFVLPVCGYLAAVLIAQGPRDTSAGDDLETSPGRPRDVEVLSQGVRSTRGDRAPG